MMDWILEWATATLRDRFPLSRIGKLLIAVGAATVFAGILFPGLVAALLPSIATPTASTGTTAVLGVSCLAIGAVALWRRAGGSDPGMLTLEPPEDADSESIALSGRALDRHIAQAKAIQPMRPDYESRSQVDIDGRLRDAAVDTYQRATGVSTASAVNAIDSGVWTEDPVAAVRVGEPDEVELPLTHWLRRRIDPKGAYELEVERTAAAIERVATND